MLQYIHIQLKLNQDPTDLALGEWDIGKHELLDDAALERPNAYTVSGASAVVLYPRNSSSLTRIPQAYAGPYGTIGSARAGGA